MSRWKCYLRGRFRNTDSIPAAEGAVLCRYRWIVAGIAVVLLVSAGIITLAGNSEPVLQEKAVKSSDIYSFSFVSQESGKDSDEVYYSDSFFGRPNNEYDHELARASLALSMTAFKKKDVMSFMEELGYGDLAAYRYDQTGDEDKVALVMGHKFDDTDPDASGTDSSEKKQNGQTGDGYADDSAKNIIAVAIRGGRYGDEWGSNGRVGHEGETFGYHYGFHEAARDAVAQLKEYAADNSLELGESVIWITGFSRGAAVANVMGAMLLGETSATGSGADDSGFAVILQGSSLDPETLVTISPGNLFCYTFASPNTVSESIVTTEESQVAAGMADSQVAAGTAGNSVDEINAGGYTGIYNIVNPLDIVTRLPMNARGISKSSNNRTVRYNWDYTKYGTTLELPAESETAQLQVVDLLENALAFATRNEVQYVEKTQDQVMIPALKKTLGKGADVNKRNVGLVLVESLPGVTSFLKDEIDRLDLRAQIYVAGILSGRKSLRLEKEHWPETYWSWMVKMDELEKL